LNFPFEQLKVLKLLSRFFLWLTLAMILLAGMATYAVYQFKDRIIQQVVTELNKELNTKVTVQKIDIAFWETFPKVSLHFHQIHMLGAFGEQAAPLLVAEKLLLSFNIQDLYMGRYQIAESSLENADLHFVIRQDGQNNFTVWKSKKGDSSAVSFEMDKMRFKNVKTVFENQFNQQTYDVFCNKGEARFTSQKGSWDAKIEGDFFVHKISIDLHDYLASKQLHLNSSLAYDHHTGYYYIKPSDILIGESLFNLEGIFGVKTGQDINLSIRGKKTNIQTILTLLPSDLNRQLSVYKSEGDLYFNGSIKGKIDSRYAPEARFEFGCTQASFWHPDFNKKVERLSFKGLYSNGKKSNGELSSLRLENVQGWIDSKAFASDLEVRDFENPYVKFNFNGTFDMASLKQIANAEVFESLEGELKADMFFEGYQKDLQQTSTLHKVKSFGNLALTQCHFVLKDTKFKVEDLNTQFSFDHNAIHLHELTAKAQGQEIVLKGYLYHYLMYLAGTRKDLEGELQLQANRLDLEKWLLLPEKSQNNGKSLFSNESKFVFQCDVQQATYKKFECAQVKGKIVWHNQALVAEGIGLKAAGGSFAFNGNLDMAPKEGQILSGKAKCTDVKVDSLMLLFDDFGQNFITHQHLKGILYTEADLYIPLSHDYKINSKALKAKLLVNIKNGELQNFEPMQTLSRYIDAKELAYLRFQELKNTLRIENETIFLPEMAIKSNVNTVSILGTQAFSGYMDYKLKVSLKNYKKKDPDAVFGAIKEEGTNTTLFLNMKGKPGNIQVSYDTQAVKDKLKDSWKKEKEEFKNLFKSKEPAEKSKAIEVKDDEYIEID
jgi:hypothetical protein